VYSSWIWPGWGGKNLTDSLKRVLAGPAERRAHTRGLNINQVSYPQCIATREGGGWRLTSDLSHDWLDGLQPHLMRRKRKSVSFIKEVMIKHFLRGLGLERERQTDRQHLFLGRRSSSW